MNLSQQTKLTTTCGGDVEGDHTWPSKLPGTQVKSWDELSSFFSDQVKSDGEGKFVFILFYFSWCKSCMKDYPMFQNSWGNALVNYPNEVSFIKVDLDDKGDLLKYFRVNHSPTFAYIGTGGAGKTIYYQKSNGVLNESNIGKFIDAKIKENS
eukprot:403357556